MTKEELEKDYYADRPIEPYSDDDSPNDWANIAHYAEENLEKAFKRIAELEAQIEELKKQLPVWHKVADGDLPKEENKIVLCYVRIGYHGNIGRYVYRLLTRKEFKQFMPIIVWCEIPQFKE